MKKAIIALVVAAMALTGCGVGSYSVSSGKADEGYISFTSIAKQDITVSVDGTEYHIQSVKTKPYRSSDRDIKRTSLNTLTVTPGTHDVKVLSGDKEIYSKKLFISSQEHKIVAL